MKEASYYEKMDGKVRCNLCPHFCLIDKGKRGICGIRENRDGVLYALTYSRVAALSVDPVEKKPLYHFHPGSTILSVGATGCNFSCPFCQNWHLVESTVPLKDVSIESLVQAAENSGAVGISYTYNEPLIQWEFVYDCSRKFRERGLKNVLVTNGYINPGPLEELLPYIDGLNVDLKFISDTTYRKISGGSIEPVKETISTASRNCHVEVTTLIVTGLNDTVEEIDGIIDFIHSVNPEIPYHISRYFPGFRYMSPATDPSILSRAYDMARDRLKYVYLGNIQIEGSGNTTCPGCASLLVERTGYNTNVINLSGSSCGSCGEKQNFVV